MDVNFEVENKKEQIEKTVRRNSKYAQKITHKSNQNKMLAYDVKQYLQNLGFTVPSSQQDYNLQKDEILTDQETGEYFDSIDKLYKLYYNLIKVNKSVYALFFDEKTNKTKQLIVSCWYSHHKLDHIYNMRKSQLIRKVWINYLLANNHLITEHYPIHLVLTMPHSEGVYKNKEFYARELIVAFNIMRKDPIFKKYIYGGEYGIEVTQGKNGLHIHLHSLVFQRKKFKLKEVREYIQKRWEQLTGAKIIHYSTLHVYLKDDKGRWIVEDVPEKSYVELDNDWHETTVMLQEAGKRRKKFYLSDTEEWFKNLPEQEKLQHYSSGILEAIKYHFKDVSYKTETGSYDIELIHKVLINTVNLRIYSKFGNFYGENELNYSEKIEQKPIIEVEQLDTSIYEDEDNEDAELRAESLNSIVRLINPFTGEPAKKEDYQLVVSLAEKQKFYNRPERHETYIQPIIREHYFVINPFLDIKQIMMYLIKNKYLHLFINEREGMRFFNEIQKFKHSINT